MSSTSINYEPDEDIPSLEGKVILITGANTGLGKLSALKSAQHNPAHLYLTARNAEQGQAAVDEILRQSPNVNVSLLTMDLKSFESIKEAAKAFLASSSRLDILYLNAGIFGHPAALTDDGYEIHFGVNHLGHALLLRLLTPVLCQTSSSTSSATVRVVCLTSIGWKRCPPGGIPFSQLKTLDPTISPASRYIHSKLANKLYTQQIAKRYPQFTTVSVHAGEVATQLFSREPGDEQIRYLQSVVAPARTGSLEDGVKNQLWAGTAEEVVSGTYYEPVGVSAELLAEESDEGSVAGDDQGEELWSWTVRELQGHHL